MVDSEDFVKPTVEFRQTIVPRRQRIADKPVKTVGVLAEIVEEALVFAHPFSVADCLRPDFAAAVVEIRPDLDQRRIFVRQRVLFPRSPAAPV